MAQLDKIEKTIEGWLKPIPHLPVNGQKWLANNVWWIVLVGVIISALGVISLIGAIIGAASMVNTTNDLLRSYGVYSSYAHDLGWNWYAASIASLVFIAVDAIIMAMAINPLKAMKKRGWDLLFISLLLGALSSLVSIVLNFSVISFIPSLLFAAIGMAIGAYFLYEIRSFYKTSATKEAVTEPKPKE